MSSAIRVLILEDYEDDCFLLLRELKRGGFEASHLLVETPSGMVEALEQEEWDIILSDYSMPGFNAPDALKLLKESQKDIPFIVVSGNVGEIIAVQLMKHGAADFIGKDNLSRLCPAIQREITESKVRQQRLESEAITNRLWDIFNHSLNEIYVFDATTFEFVTVNEAALDNLGYTLPEVIGKHPWDINAEKNEATFKNEVNPIKNGEIDFLYFETSHKRKDGTSYPVEIRLQLSTEKKPIFYGVVLDVTERKKSIKKIENLARFPEENPEPVIRINYDYDIIYNNPSSNELVKVWNESSKYKIPNSWKNSVNICKKTNKHQYFEDKVEHRIYSWLLFPSEKGQYISCYGRDVTDQKKNEKILQQSYQVFENVTEGILICDKRDIVTAINPAFSEITGFTPKDIIGKNASILNTEKDDENFFILGKSIATLEGKWKGELHLKKSNNKKTPVNLSISTIKNEGRIHSYIYVFSDVSEKKLALEHIHNLSYFDPVTNLPNRFHTHEKLIEVLDKAKVFNLNVSIIYLDLRRFKTINESLGHQTADRALSLVANRISAAIPKNTFFSRMGADEFIIIIEDLKISSTEHEIIQCVASVFDQPFELQGQETYLNVTIGVSHYPNNGLSPEELVKYAELAVTHAKHKGKSIEIYSHELNSKNKEHIKLETNLRKALERDEYLLYYQPQIDLKTKKIVGLEALIRWNRPETGLVSPADFIPLLEETGLILLVGNWVIEEACRQLKEWENEGLTGIKIAVNLSGKQFNQNNLAENILKILDCANVSPASIELEVTESTIMQQYEEVISTLQELHDQGFTISIDDFGTGYSSLAYLKHFPIDILKVDQSFVMEIPDDKDDTAIVNTIISMGHNLNLKVIAEGVENVEQMKSLTAMGCEIAQGFYFSKPVPAGNVVAFLKKHND